MKKDKKKDCLIIGFGRMGQKWHQVLKDLKFENIFIVEKSLNKLNKEGIINKINKSNIYSNLGECLKIAKPHIAIVSTTADSHKNYAIKLAKNNVKNLIVEKPMATSVNDCEEIIKVCKKNKIRLSVNHQTRFTDEIKLLKRIISKYKLGKLVSMNVVGGNGGLSMIGTHFIEIFNYLTQKKIFAVSSSLDKKTVRNPRGKQFKDNSGQIIAKNNNNQILYLNLSCFQGHGININYTFKNGNILVNRKGYLNINVRKNFFFNSPMNLYDLPEINKNYKFKKNNLLLSTKYFIKNFLTKKNYPSGYDGLEAIKVLVAALESNKLSGKFKKISKINTFRKYPWA